MRLLTLFLFGLIISTLALAQKSNLREQISDTVEKYEVKGTSKSSKTRKLKSKKIDNRLLEDVKKREQEFAKLLNSLEYKYDKFKKNQSSIKHISFKNERPSDDIISLTLSMGTESYEIPEIAFAFQHIEEREILNFKFDRQNKVLLSAILKSGEIYKEEYKIDEDLSYSKKWRLSFRNNVHSKGSLFSLEALEVRKKNISDLNIDQKK